MEDFLHFNQKLVILFLLGLILIGFGMFVFKNGVFTGGDKVEVLNDTTKSEESIKEMVVEISGAVYKPGVFKLTKDARVEDLLIMSGGLSADADRDWVTKNINRASKLFDGQKIYIKSQSEVLSANSDSGIKLYQGENSLDGGGLVDINTASLSELDKLPGIGQVYGQNIIEQRPYSNTEELVKKGVLKESIYEKLKDKITAY